MLDQGRRDPQLQARLRQLGQGEELERVPELGRVGDVGQVQAVDPLARDLRRRDAGAEGELGQDGQLVGGVGPVDVEGGVGLGVAEVLGLSQGGGVGEAAVGHRRQDEVAGAVEDRRQSLDLVGRQRDPERLDDRDAAGDAPLEDDRAARPPRLGEDLGPVLGQQGLVRRDDVLAGRQGVEDDPQGRVRPAHRLDHDRHLGVVQDAPGVGHDPGVAQGRLARPGGVADHGPFQVDPTAGPSRDPFSLLDQQARDPAADRAQAQQTDRHPFHPVLVLVVSEGPRPERPLPRRFPASRANPKLRAPTAPRA